jgi:predicted ATPase
LEREMILKPGLFAVTGGPGAGKTTLLHHLQRMGHAIAHENARAVIRAEIARTGVRPTGGLFVQLVLQADVDAFHAAEGRTFFDRSLVDAWATARLQGLHLREADEAVATLRLNRLAFIAPPWREIYVQDAERIQTWAQAVSAYEGCAEAYEAADYRLMQLPRTDVATRAAFVLDAAARA